MILTYPRLRGLIETGIITNGQLSAVSGTSIDIHLGSKILLEKCARGVVDYRARDPLVVEEVEIPEDGYVVYPGRFILAHSVEWLNMPLSLSALLRTKSSMGRIGFEHLDAGWIDPGFAGALTLEFTNVLQYTSFRIRAGDPVGQLVFFEHEAVPIEHSYVENGRYSGHRSVQQTRVK